MTDFELVPKDPERRISGDISFAYDALLNDIVKSYISEKESKEGD